MKCLKNTLVSLVGCLLASSPPPPPLPSIPTRSRYRDGAKRCGRAGGQELPRPGESWSRVESKSKTVIARQAGTRDGPAAASGAQQPLARAGEGPGRGRRRRRRRRGGGGGFVRAAIPALFLTPAKGDAPKPTEEGGKARMGGCWC